jgi:septum formation protein
VDSDIDESILANESPIKYVERLAYAKAEKGLRNLLDSGQSEWTLGASKSLAVLSADTTVFTTDSILGKPESREAALNTLQTLSGSEHQVATAVAVLSGNFTSASASELPTLMKSEVLSDVVVSQSRVIFKTLSQNEIEAYCGLNEPYDKAGAYAVQGVAAMFIERIEGSYSGIMGLPLFETAAVLNRHGVPAALGLVRE